MVGFRMSGEFGELGTGMDEVGRFVAGAAFLALIASSFCVAAFGTGADDIAVGEEFFIFLRIELLGDALFDEPVAEEVLEILCGGFDMPRPGGARVVVERKFELGEKVFEDLVEMIDVLFGSFSGHLCAEGDGDAMFIGAANVEDVIALEPFEARIAIARQIGPGDVAKMEGAVRIGERRRDEDLFHGDYSASSFLLSGCLSCSAVYS